MVKLTEEMIVARTRVSDMCNVKKLNCWGAELNDVSVLRNLYNVEVLSLSVNCITTLADVQGCKNLQELYIRKNQIQDLNEICWLKNLTKLKNLWLEENPCAQGGGEAYRLTVIRNLPQLQKLDNVVVPPDEVSDALRRGMELVHPRDRLLVEDGYYAPRSYQQPYDGPLRRASSQILRQPMISSPPSNSEASVAPQYQRRESTPASYSFYNAAEQRESYQGGYDNRGTSAHHVTYTTDDGCVPESYAGRRYSQQVHSPVQRASRSSSSYVLEDPSPKTSIQQGYDERESVNGYEIRQMRYSSSGPVTDSQSCVTANDSRVLESEREYVARHYDNTFEQVNQQIDTARQLVEDRKNSRDPPERAYPRRPKNRNSNILSAVLCLIKELDGPSLEVLEMAVRCRMEELED